MHRPAVRLVPLLSCLSCTASGDESISGLAALDVDEPVVQESEHSARQPAGRPLKIDFSVQGAPEGVDRNTWARVAWLPASSTAIASYKKGKMMPMVDFVRSFVVEDGPPVCAKVLDAVRGYHQVEFQTPPKPEWTHVYHGSMRKDEFDSCLSFYSEQFHFEVKHLGAYTVIGGEKEDTVFGWADHGDMGIVVQTTSVDKAKRVIENNGARVASVPEYAKLLARVDEDADMWVVGKDLPPDAFLPGWGAYSLSLYMGLDEAIAGAIEVRASGTITFKDEESSNEGRAHFQRVRKAICSGLNAECELVFTALGAVSSTAHAFKLNVVGDAKAVGEAMVAPETLGKIKGELGLEPAAQ